MKILITGASGFIGKRLAESLRESKEFELVLTGRKPIPDLNGIEFRAADLTDAASTEAAVRGVDAIVHCAGLAGTWGPYEDYFQANVVATKNLVLAAKKFGVKRLINISSPSIYFAYRHQFNLREEQVPKKFSNAYAETKFLAEQVVASNHSSSFQTVSLRPRAVIGRGDKNILPRLVQLQKSGGLIQVGNGENLVDFTSVQNLIDAIILCLRAPAQALGGAYNISNGEPIRFWDFVDLLLKEMSQQRKIKKLPYAFVMALALANEKLAKIFRSPKEPALLPITVGVLHYSMTLDISRARKNLHYSSQQNTLSAIKEWLGK